MFEMTPEQAALVTAIVTFFPLLFQYVQLVAAQPFLATHVAKVNLWLQSKTSVKTDDVKRAFVLILALIVLLASGVPILPDLPENPAFTTAYAVLFLTWCTNALLSIVALQRWIHLMFKHLWQHIFAGSLDSSAIREKAIKNVNGSLDAYKEKLGIAPSDSPPHGNEG